MDRRSSMLFDNENRRPYNETNQLFSSQKRYEFYSEVKEAIIQSV